MEGWGESLGRPVIMNQKQFQLDITLLVLYLPLIVMVTIISKEGKFVLKMFKERNYLFLPSFLFT